MDACPFRRFTSSEGRPRSYVRVQVLLNRRMDDEDDIVFRLEAGDDSPIAGFVSYRLFVDLRDDGALDEVELVGKGPRATLVTMTPFLLPVFAATDGGMAVTVMPSVAWPASDSCGAALSSLSPPPAISIGLCSIADGDVSGVLLAVAEVAEFDGRADFTGGDVGHEVVAVLDVAAIDGDDDIAGLKPSLAAPPVGETVLTMTPLEKPYMRPTAELRSGWKLMPMEPRTTLCSGPMSML